jgi:hypothetical protein
MGDSSRDADTMTTVSERRVRQMRGGRQSSSTCEAEAARVAYRTPVVLTHHPVTQMDDSAESITVSDQSAVAIRQKRRWDICRGCIHDFRKINFNSEYDASVCPLTG